MKNILTQLFGAAVTEDALKQFNAELGAKFVAKADFNTKLEEIKTLKGEKKNLEDKIGELTETANSAEDYKNKLETLQNDIKEKEKQAEADRKEKEKADGIAARFETVVGEKKFSHDAVRADYLKKFGEALDNTDYQGKSDAEIFHALTKDDAAAFENVKAFHLEGGANKGFGGDSGIDLGKLDMADYIKARNEMKG